MPDSMDGTSIAVATRTHGRVLVRRTASPVGALVGLHGYMENAEIQMDRLAALPAATRWTLVSVQGLHRFYLGRTHEVVASWMTRQDRDLAIEDNIGYVDAALDAFGHGLRTPLVHVGFSQGVAMAFRAGVRGRHEASAVVAVGGDVPPELLRNPAARFPAVLLLRGARDDWYTQPKFEKDVTALASRGVQVESAVYDGGHDWNDAVVARISTFLSVLAA